MWFTFVMAHLFIFPSFQPRLAATLLRSCSVVNSLTRRTGLSPVFQPTSLAQRMIESGHRHVLQARLKKAGAAWLIDTADKMANLRVLRANGQWLSLWN